MKIGTNFAGNYNPYNVSNVNKLNKTQNINKVNKTQETANIQTNNNIAENDAISKEEKTFFADMYPEKSSEIVDYHFYQRSGKMNGVSVGTLFDKRG